MTAFADDLEGASGSIDGRVSTSGHTWWSLNNNGVLDGSGRLIRDPDKPASGSTGGCYNQIALDQPVTGMSATVSWLGTSTQLSESSSCILLYSLSNTRNQNTFPNITVFSDFVHPVFSNRSLSIDVYTNGVADPSTKSFFTYATPCATDGTLYDIGFEVRGRIMTVKGPDGVTRQIAHPLFESYRGKFIDYQCYDSVWPQVSPRFHSVAARTDPFEDYVPPLPLPAVLGAELTR